MTRRKEIAAVAIAGALLLAAAITGSKSVAKPAPTPGMMAMGGNYHLQDAWARINPVAGRPSAAYLTIHYSGKTADALIAASTPIAGRVELHNHVMTKGVMRMVKAPAIAIAPGSETILKPGGLHLMLYDLKSAPKPGTKVPLTLSFKSGAKLTLMMVAQDVTAMGPSGKSTAVSAHDHH